MTKKPLHLGTIGVTKATLFDRKGKKVGYCLDTPNAIAKALMELPQAQKVTSILGTYARSYYEDRMKGWNEAKSGLELASADFTEPVGERKLLAPPYKQDPWFYTVEELRRICEENGLPTDGKKEDLIYRLFKLETPPWAPAVGLVWSPRYHAWLRQNR